MDEFIITFNSMPKITIHGQDPNDYFIEIYEHRKGERELITDFNLLTNNYICFFREWYCDYEINIWNWDEEDGIYLVNSHRYDDKDKNVLINLDTFKLHEAMIWLDKAIEYRDLHKCNLIIQSVFKKEQLAIDSSIKVIESLGNPDDYYAIYNIGKYDTEYEWSGRLAETVLNKVWDKNRTYCSYRNPRDWHYSPLDDVAADILGLNEF